MSSFFGSETFRPAFDSKPTPKLSYGLRFPQACAKHVKETLKCSRVYVIVSKSLYQNSNAFHDLQAALGDLIVGYRVGISPHTPVREVVEIIEDARGLNVECLVTLGASSITDGAKLVRFALANKAFTEKEVLTLWGGKSHNPRRRENINLPTIPLLCIPTSLSGAEYQAIAGATESESHAKRTWEPRIDPDIVIQDPELCLTTPEWVWLSTGVRSIDHCVETLCSLQSNERGDEMARKGLKKLVPGLILSKRGENAISARHMCQLGVVEAMAAVSSGVPLGASHAIGHQLGPLGVGHGQTSCILLPAVCKFNAAKGANVRQQAQVADLLKTEPLVQQLLSAHQLDPTKADLGDLLDLIFRELGMPRSLKDVNVPRDKLETLAANSLDDIWIRTNAVPITETKQVMEILETVVG